MKCNSILSAVKWLACLIILFGSFFSVAQTAFDYDGDDTADLAVRRTSNFSHYVSNSTDNHIQRVKFGLNDKDIPISGDFDGDGIFDFGVRRVSNKTWYILNSSGNDLITGNSDGVTRFHFGNFADDIPVPADYDGDGITDIAIRRPSNQTWYIVNSSGTDPITQQSDGVTRLKFGLKSGDIPVPADYDGDGKADMAVRRPENKYWYIKNTSGIDQISGNSDGITRIAFGLQSEDIPVVADYDGDGKSDIAVRRPSSFQWFIRNSSGVDVIDNENDGVSRITFGRNSDDIPVIADYDGDGLADIAVRRPANQTWYIRNSSGSDARTHSADGISRIRFGLQTSDIPLAMPQFKIWLNSDVDYDGLTNAEEAKLGTDITLSDTDGDGLSDADEVNVHNTDPINEDMDSDGIKDGEEVASGTDPHTFDNPDFILSEAFFANTSGYLSHGKDLIEGYVEEALDYYEYTSDKSGVVYFADPLLNGQSREFDWSYSEENGLKIQYPYREHQLLTCDQVLYNFPGGFEYEVYYQISRACQLGLLSDGQIQSSYGLSLERWQFTTFESGFVDVEIDKTKEYIITLPDNIADLYGSDWIGGNVFEAHLNEQKSMQFVFNNQYQDATLEPAELEGNWALPIYFTVLRGDAFGSNDESNFYKDLVVIKDNTANAKLSNYRFQVGATRYGFELNLQNERLKYTTLKKHENTYQVLVERFIDDIRQNAIVTRMTKVQQSAINKWENIALAASEAYLSTSQNALLEHRENGAILADRVKAKQVIANGTFYDIVATQGSPHLFDLLTLRNNQWELVLDGSNSVKFSRESLPWWRTERHWLILDVESNGRMNVLEYLTLAVDYNNDKQFSDDEHSYFITPKIETYETVDMTYYYQWNYMDIDNDDLVNQNELAAGTNLYIQDTDGDGYTDGEEVYWLSSDPLDAQSTPLLIDEVEISDENLKNCIEQALSRYDDNEKAVGRVSNLNCSNSGIQDISGLRHFRNLNTLYLGDNEIEDITSISSLPWLNVLSLDSNNVSDVSPLTSNSELSNLNLNSNDISDITPLEQLTKLRGLTLNNNHIENIDALGNLNKLGGLELSNNNILSVESLLTVDHLNWLNIEGNENLNCDSLYEIQQHFHPIDTNPPEHCTGREIDTSLITDANLLACIQETELTLNELEELDCSGLGITELTGIEQFYALRYLTLSNNSISDIQPLSQLTSLREIATDYNQIADLSPLANLEQLYSISMDHNTIEDISALVDKRLNNVSLNNNRLTTLPFPHESLEWSRVELNNNLLNDISAMAHFAGYSFEAVNNQISDISALANIRISRVLNLSGNQISDISALSERDGAFYCSELNISDNQIADISPLMSANIERLNLSNNNIDDFNPIADIRGLESLYMSNTGVTDLTFLTPHTDIWELDLSRNQITDLSPIEADFRSLRVLNLNSNLIEDMPSPYFLRSIKELYLDDNKISSLRSFTEFEDDSFTYKAIILSLKNNAITETGDFRSGTRRFFYLEKLYLGGNQIEELSDFDFMTSSSVFSLKELHLNNNLISNFNNIHIDEIELLNLSGNRLTALDEVTAYGVKQYDLSNNQINDISGLARAAQAERFELLDRIDLSGNQLTDISPFTEPGFSYLEELDLSENDSLYCEQIADISASHNDIDINIPAHCAP